MSETLIIYALVQEAEGSEYIDNYYRNRADAEAAKEQYELRAINSYNKELALQYNKEVESWLLLQGDFQALKDVGRRKGNFTLKRPDPPVGITDINELPFRLHSLCRYSIVEIEVL